MKPRSVSLAVVLLAGACGVSPAAAFQETDPRPLIAAPNTAAQAPGMAFDLESKDADSGKTAKQGKRKHGLGSLDVLPKTLDFGLELLYGSPEPDASSRFGIDDLMTDDMTIRGTIKRRF
jgi:hypothetical protein